MTESTFEKVGDYLEHHGIKNQKWGVRRYQYEDGRLTPEGREHYGVGPARDDGYIDSNGVPHIGLQFFAEKKNEAEKVDLSTYSKEERDMMTQYVKDAKLQSEYEKYKAIENKTPEEIESERKLKVVQDYNLQQQYEKALASESGPDPAKAATDILKVSQGFFRERRKSGIAKKDYSDIPTDELKKRVDRLNLEQNYGRLTGDTHAVATGRDKVHEFLQDVFIVASIAGILIPLFSKKKSNPVIN